MQRGIRLATASVFCLLLFALSFQSKKWNAYECNTHTTLINLYRSEKTSYLHYPSLLRGIGWRQPQRQLFMPCLPEMEWTEHNCSYECNSPYGDIVPTLLLQFLWFGTWTEACFACSTGWPSIAVPLGAAHPPWGDIFCQTEKSTETMH